MSESNTQRYAESKKFTHRLHDNVLNLQIDTNREQYIIIPTKPQTTDDNCVINKKKKKTQKQGMQIIVIMSMKEKNENERTAVPRATVNDHFVHCAL